MKVFKLGFVSVLALMAATACKQSDPPLLTDDLVWSDEFDGNELDESKWEVQLGTGASVGLYLWGNNEAQFYRKENITVENGMLKIRAQRENFGDMLYTSARIRSLNKGDFKYGRIEARIRMDNTPGLWHAFWMLPSNPSQTWPVSGEIDIMEYVGNQSNSILHYIHFANTAGNHQYKGVDVPFTTANTQFHVYAVVWDETEIVWYIDDLETQRITRDDPDAGPNWPFDSNRFHILLNTAVGGNLGGNINVQALTQPRYMEVDYVRVYQ
jgi:beta-glucanase (GH16 family)